MIYKIGLIAGVLVALVCAVLLTLNVGAEPAAGGLDTPPSATGQLT